MRAVSRQCKKTTQQTIYNLKKIKENAHAQNSTFANRTNRHTTNVAKELFSSQRTQAHHHP
jgi:flagellar biogenesis protein FliO